MPETWYQSRGNGRLLLLDLYIQPNASRTEIAGLHDGSLKIKVAAPPNDHQANDKLLEFLGKSFKVNRRQVILKRGEHSRHKIVEITGSDVLPEAIRIDK
jgi:uncharacterized protein